MFARFSRFIIKQPKILCSTRIHLHEWQNNVQKDAFSLFSKYFLKYDLFYFSRQKKSFLNNGIVSNLSFLQIVK